jgi:NAD(P)-dependent dehydrogenase (short-subunit alcohol dehydrogenase family)
VSVPAIASARPARRSPLARQTAAAGLLAAACTVWAALPLQSSGPSKIFGVLTAVCAVLATIRLATAGVRGDPSVYHSGPATAGLAALHGLQSTPWAEGVVVFGLALEGRHHAPAYHTALLGVALLAFLFATHLAEAGVRTQTLRPQVPLLAAGLGLLAVTAGASLLPVPAGPLGDWLRFLALVAALVVGALALPA